MHLILISEDLRGLGLMKRKRLVQKIVRAMTGSCTPLTLNAEVFSYSGLPEGP